MIYMNRIGSLIIGLLFIGLIVSTVQAAPPDVTLVTPNGGSISGTINLEATATDTDGNITQVQFFYNNNGTNWVPIGLNTSSSGDSYYFENWDTTSVPNGNNYSFRANATDNNSDTANDTSDAAVTIANNLKPIVSLNSPSSGSTVNKLVILNATAIDYDGSISDVTFEYKLSTDSSWTGPYSYDNNYSDFYLKNWDTETIVNGPYDIRVTATDDDSATNSSITSGITVNNTPNVPPEVTINVPKSGQIYNGTVLLNATASDADGIITDVTFEYYDGSGWNSLGSNTSKSGDYYFLNWDTVPRDNGDNYQIRANAIDNRTGTATNTTGTFSIYNNHLPELSDAGATPESGITPQEFEFKVTYTDSDNESATYVRLVIEGVDTYDMSPIDFNDPEDGIVYNYSKTLTTTTSSTTYKYHFIAQDVNGSKAYATSEKSVEVNPATYESGNRIWVQDAGMSEDTYTWTPQSFSGFYYDLDNGIGKETLTIEDIDRSLGSGDIIYETKPISIDFEQDIWKTYEVIGFMADRYFAGYTDDTTFASSSNSLLDERQLSKVLMDTDKNYNVRSGTPLELEEGYDFRIAEFGSGGDAVMVAMFKNGERVAEDIVEEGDTFVYEKDMGGARDMPIIAIYFDNVFVGTETSTVVIEGIFQISDKYIDFSTGDEFGLMEIKSASSSGITMKNDNSVSLGQGDDFNLMGKINIIVADSSTLRFAPYVDMSEPGTYELRGTVTEETTFVWTPFNFEGLLYNIDTGDGKETLEIVRSGTSVNEDKLTYTTNPISMNFEHSGDGWGTFQSIGFMGDTYFAGYNSNSFVSSDRSLIKEGKLSKILIDEDKKYTLYIGNSITLQEGYSLRIDEISRTGDALMFTLLRNGNEITTDISSEEDTFIYDVDVDGTDIPIIVAHIDKVFRGMETNSVFIDGLFQISESFATINTGDSYGIMEVTSFSSSSIVLKNEDSFSLSRGDTVNIMGDIKFKVADSGTVRFYPFQEIIVEEPLYLDLDIPDSIYENEEFTILVTSDGDEVEDVSIFFDDSEIGTTDSNGELIYTPIETGEIKVTASKSGYESDSKNIEVLYQPKVLEISAPLLVDKGETIVISVTSEGKSVSGVEVMFGSNDLGTTPASGNITHTPDQIGTHTITASKSGYQDASKDIDITDPGAKLVYSNLTIEPKSVQPGENVNITVEAANFGTLRDADTMTIKVNGEEIATEDLVLGPGEIMTLEFTMNRSKPGTYLVEIDGRSDTFKVVGSQVSSLAIVILAILVILSTTAVIYGFAQGTLSFDIIIGKAQAFERSLRRLIEK
jgi:S-layer protein (TIGR01567 family)